MEFVIFEFSLIKPAIFPRHFTSSVFLVVFPLTFVNDSGVRSILALVIFIVNPKAIEPRFVFEDYFAFAILLPIFELARINAAILVCLFPLSFDHIVLEISFVEDFTLCIENFPRALGYLISVLKDCAFKFISLIKIPRILYRLIRNFFTFFRIYTCGVFSRLFRG